VGVGVQATADPKGDLQETLATTPFALSEAGGGMYRSNGDRCAKTKRAAFTVLGKGGLRYYFDTRDEVVGQDNTGYGLDYTVGDRTRILLCPRICSPRFRGGSRYRLPL
jgi:hypothetical protein